MISPGSVALAFFYYPTHRNHVCVWGQKDEGRKISSRTLKSKNIGVLFRVNKGFETLRWERTRTRFFFNPLLSLNGFFVVFDLAAGTLKWRAVLIYRGGHFIYSPEDKGLLHSSGLPKLVHVLLDPHFTQRRLFLELWAMSWGLCVLWGVYTLTMPLSFRSHSNMVPSLRVGLFMYRTSVSAQCCLRQM